MRKWSLDEKEAALRSFEEGWGLGRVARTGVRFRTLRMATLGVRETLSTGMAKATEKVCRAGLRLSVGLCPEADAIGERTFAEEHLGAGKGDHSHEEKSD